MIHEIRHKRVLIISHNCLSQTGSNGRTLRNYLLGWPKDSLAQLYIHPEAPDFEICERYFCISDSDVLHSIARRTDAGRIVERVHSELGQHAGRADRHRKRTKHSLIFLLRELAWNSRLWKTSGMWDWLEQFQPEAILFQAGDAGFLFRLTIDIADRFCIPVILYNTEGYYFKEVSYLPETPITNMFYPCLHRYFCRQYRRLMERTQLSIYNCDMLASDYQKAFPHKSAVIMNSSELADRKISVSDIRTHHIVYAGNVGVGRHKSIISVAQAAHSIDPELYVDIYANIKDDTVKQELMQCPGVRLQGFVSYAELQLILQRAEYLLHVENFDSFYCEDLKYAFSTKIADSLAAGGCLIVYAPANIAVSQYLSKSDAVLLISRPEESVLRLQTLFEDHSFRERLRINGRQLALLNHSLDRNRAQFQEYVSEAICDEGSASQLCIQKR